MYFKFQHSIFVIIIAILIFTGCQSTQPDTSPKKRPVKEKIKQKPKTTSTIRISPNQKKTLEIQFKTAYRLINSLPSNLKQTISWKELHNTINFHRNKKKYSKGELAAAHKLLYFFQSSSSKLKKIYNFKYYQWQGTNIPARKQFKKSGRIYAPIPLLSMWYHCKTNVGYQYPNIKMELIAGFQSPAYQAIKLFKAGKTLTAAIKAESPPYFSRHQLSNPDISILISNRNVKSVSNTIVKACKSFGFRLVRGPYLKNIIDLKFVDLKSQYKKLLSNKRVTPRLKANILKTLDKIQFYPSPKGLSVIMAMAEKESGLNWNPKIGKHKKKELRKRFNKYFAKSKSGIIGYLANIVLSKKQKQKQQALAKKLYSLTDVNNKKTTEYDVYLWSRSALKFFQGILKRHKNVSSLGKIFVNIGAIERKLKFEPQTFGLWQLNINHFIEKLQSSKYYRKRYSKIFNGKQVNRDALVKSLSGYNAPLGRLQTLDMIFKVRLIPRYFSHLNGSNLDLLFFSAENLAGEFSTYRAVIQKEINRKLKTKLSIDGDLAIFYPYSTKINWKKQSNTQKALLKYIQKLRKKHKTRLSNSRLLMDICLANTKSKLYNTWIYKRLFKTKKGIRMFPEIKSDLYKESPKQYAYKVLRFSKNYYR